MNHGVYLAVWTTATRFSMEWPIMSWGESSRCRKLQHTSSPEPDVVTTLRRCYVNYTGFLFGGEWSSNSPLFGAPGIVRSNAYLPGWWHPSRLQRQPTSIQSSSDNMCAVPRTHNSFGDRSFFRCRPTNLEQFAARPTDTWHQLQTF